MFRGLLYDVYSYGITYLAVSVFGGLLPYQLHLSSDLDHSFFLHDASLLCDRIFRIYIFGSIYLVLICLSQIVPGDFRFCGGFTLLTLKSR